MKNSKILTIPANRIRLRIVDDRLRCSELLDDVSGQTATEPHADANNCASQSRISRQAQRHDYANVFASLEKALAIYGAGKGGATPVRDKAELLAEFRKVLDDATEFCRAQQTDLTG